MLQPWRSFVKELRRLLAQLLSIMVLGTIAIVSITYMQSILQLALSVAIMIVVFVGSRAVWRNIRNTERARAYLVLTAVAAGVVTTIGFDFAGWHRGGGDVATVG